MTRERWTGIGVLILGILILAVIIPLGIDRPGNVEHAALAPDFWPGIIAAIIALTGLWLAVRPARKDGGEEEDGEDSGRWRQRLPGLAVTLGALFGFYLLIPYLGMVAPGALLIFCLMTYAGERRWWPRLAFAGGVPVLLYVFFAYVARIPIPLGVFETLRG